MLSSSVYDKKVVVMQMEPWITMNSAYFVTLVANPCIIGVRPIINNYFKKMFLDKRNAVTNSLLKQGKVVDEKSLVPTKKVIMELFPWTLYLKYESMIDVISDNIDILITTFTKTNFINESPYEQLWELSINPGAVSLLKRYPFLIHWEEFCLNTSNDAIDMILLEMHRDISSTNLYWNQLSKNVTFIQTIVRTNLSIKILQYIDWYNLSNNHCVEAISLISDNIHLSNVQSEICWQYLSCNPFAVHLLLTNIHKINWRFVASNYGLDVSFINQNIHNINFYVEGRSKLCANPVAIHIISSLYDEYCIKRSTMSPTIIKHKSHITFFGFDIESTIDWYQLSTNTHPLAIEIIKKEMVHDIHLKLLAKKQNITPNIVIDYNVNYSGLFSNPMIFSPIFSPN